jgi:hypothetical protein
MMAPQSASAYPHMQRVGKQKEADTIHTYFEYTAQHLKRKLDLL